MHTRKKSFVRRPDFTRGNGRKVDRISKTLFPSLPSLRRSITEEQGTTRERERERKKETSSRKPTKKPEIEISSVARTIDTHRWSIIDDQIERLIQLRNRRHLVQISAPFQIVPAGCVSKRITTLFILVLRRVFPLSFPLSSLSRIRGTIDRIIGTSELLVGLYMALCTISMMLTPCVGNWFADRKEWPKPYTIIRRFLFLWYQWIEIYYLLRLGLNVLETEEILQYRGKRLSTWYFQ